MYIFVFEREILELSSIYILYEYDLRFIDTYRIHRDKLHFEKYDFNLI